MGVKIQLSRRERLSEEQLQPFTLWKLQTENQPPRPLHALPRAVRSPTPSLHTLRRSKAPSARGSPPTTRINLYLAGQWGCPAQPGGKAEEENWVASARSACTNATPTYAQLLRQQGPPWQDNAARSSVLTSFPTSSPFSI